MKMPLISIWEFSAFFVLNLLPYFSEYLPPDGTLSSRTWVLPLSLIHISALVECGFLSNGAEEAKLNDDTYQEQMAWGIYCGILDYFAAKDGAGGLQLAEKRI